MTPSEERDLSLAVAAACGWKRYGTGIGLGDPREWWVPPWSANELIAFDDDAGFANSLDLCFGRGGPVEYAIRKQGWYFSASHFDGKHSYTLHRGHGSDTWIGSPSSDISASVALCRAFLSAVACAAKEAEAQP